MSLRRVGRAGGAASLEQGVNRRRRGVPALGCGGWFWVWLLVFVPGLHASDAALLRLRDWVEQPAFAQATWGVMVLDARSGATLYETNAHRLLKPGSNGKLFTAALALDLLGADFRIRTDLLSPGALSRRGTLRGDLVVRGRGDFSWSSRFRGSAAGGPLGGVVDALVSQGIRRVSGDLVLDDAFLPGISVGTGWTWDDLQYYYGAPAAALCVEDNAVDLVMTPGRLEGEPVRATLVPQPPGMLLETSDLVTGAASIRAEVTVDRHPAGGPLWCRGAIPAGGGSVTQSVPVLDPVRWTGVRLREALVARGIQVGGDVRVERGAASRPAHGIEPRVVASVDSPALSELVTGMMKPSQNLHAQLLLLQCGARSEGGGTNAREASGVRAMERFVARVGIPPGEVRLDDGAGLSRSALVTPNAVVALLRAMERHPHSDLFFGSLPVAGVDGTLRQRFRDTPAAGNLKAKTGTLRYVNALSGVVTDRAGRRLMFSVLLNAYAPESGRPSGREAVDELVRRIVNLGENPSEARR